MKKEQKPRASKETGTGEEPESTGSSRVTEIKHAIANGFGEYRRQIADIRARHGRKARQSLEILN